MYIIAIALLLVAMAFIAYISRRGEIDIIGLLKNDIVFVVTPRISAQDLWGFFNINTLSVEVMTVGPGWDYPTVTPDRENVVFRRLPNEDRDMANISAIFGGTATELGLIGRLADGGTRLCGTDSGLEIGRIRWSSIHNQLLVTTREPVEIALLNPDNCEISQVLYHPHNQEQTLRNAMVSTNGLLVFSSIPLHFSSTSSLGEVVIVDMVRESILFTIDRATNPVWSPDGTRLAYVGIDGIYITDIDDFRSHEQRVVDYQSVWNLEGQNGEQEVRWQTWLPVPEWSPDGTKLIYHRWVGGALVGANTAFNIYIYDTVVEQETLIIQNGMNPYWIPRE